jgi:hypothetical protein
MVRISRISVAFTTAWAIACVGVLGPDRAVAQGAARPLGPAIWGNPNQPWGVRRSVTDADRALIATYRSGHGQPVLQEDFTHPAELQTLWSLQSDDQSKLKSCRRPENVVITSNELQLRTLNARDCQAKWSTGSLISKARQKYGFFEARMKIADISGLNNAFWLVTTDHFEIDVAEVHYPNDVRLTLHNNNNWDTEKDDRSHAVGFDSRFADNFSKAYHDYGVLWTPAEIIFEVDGNPIAAIETDGVIQGAADIRFSTAVTEFGGKIPANPAGHDMYVRGLRVFSYEK